MSGCRLKNVLLIASQARSLRTLPISYFRHPRAARRLPLSVRRNPSSPSSALLPPTGTVLSLGYFVGCKVALQEALAAAVVGVGPPLLLLPYPPRRDSVHLARSAGASYQAQ